VGKQAPHLVLVLSKLQIDIMLVYSPMWRFIVMMSGLEMLLGMSYSIFSHVNSFLVNVVSGACVFAARVRHA
jgi:hypothetical protein